MIGLKEIFDETKNIIISLKTQVEEAKTIEEVLRAQLKEKEDSCNNLEFEIVYLRKELEKSHTNTKFENISTTLNEILNRQISPFDKTSLGYNENKEAANEEASTSSKQSKTFSNLYLNHSIISNEQ